MSKHLKKLEGYCRVPGTFAKEGFMSIYEMVSALFDKTNETVEFVNEYTDFLVVVESGEETRNNVFTQQIDSQNNVFTDFIESSQNTFNSNESQRVTQYNTLVNNTNNLINDSISSLIETLEIESQQSIEDMVAQWSDAMTTENEVWEV